MKTKILFRADGSSAIGLGHIYRSCALAQILKDHFSTIFFIREPVKDLETDILASVDLIITLETSMDIEAETSLIASHSEATDIIVLDGYHFTGVYQQSLKSKTKAAIVCIDDIHKGYYQADAVINHIGGISISDYESGPSTAFFLGIEYALVNKVFFEVKPQWNDKNNLLICLGGADPSNETVKVLSSIPLQRFDHVNVIVGSGYQHRRILDAHAAGKPIIVHQHIKPGEVAAVMAACKYSVLAPSTVSYEYMHVGGIVYLHQIADNQKRVKEFFLQHRLALELDQINKKSVSEEELLQNQQRYFDRQSHSRLLKLFDGLSFMKQCKIRKAATTDVDVTFKWANDPLARSMSYNNGAIAYETHVNWFGDKIAEASSPYYIFEKDNKAVAQIRFDVENTLAVLSYSVSEGARGKSLGVWILAEGIRQLKQEISAVRTVVGYVKETNIASCKSFEKLPFKKERAAEYPASFKYSIVI